MTSEQGQSEAAAYKAVERVLTGAVSKILSKYGNKQGPENTRTRILPHSSSQANNESSDSDDFQHSGRAKKRNKGKQPATPYPSHFLQKRSKCKPPPAKKQRIIVYDRDIICLPKSFVSEAGRIRIPRNKKDREFLVANKLVGKIQLQSDMSEAQIFNEIRSVFQSPMGCDDEFSFTILQQSGGGSKFLMVPELSSSYKWTAGAVAGRNSKVPIYILAEDRLMVSSLDSDDGEDGKQMPSESDAEEEFPSFPVTSNRTIGATKTEKDTGESSAAASKTKPYYTGSQTLAPEPPGATAPGSSSCRWTSITYRDFVNLVSDDEGAVDGLSMSPTPPPISPLTPTDECEGMPVEDLIGRQRIKNLPVDKSDVQRIVVRRNHLWEDALKWFQAGRKYVRVLFVGEPAVDDGGPLREFLHLVMGEIATNNSLFCGQEDCRVPLPNMVGLEKLTFKHIGEMMAVSIIHGGPAPNFLAQSVVDYLLYGMGKVRATIDEVPCATMKTKLYKLSSAKDVETLKILMDSEEFSFRFDVGVSDPSTRLKFTDREQIVQSLATYFIIVRAKASIDQIADGLSALGVLEMMRANPQAMRKLFLHRPVLNADYLLNLFKPRLSAPGTNRREDEEQLIMYWVNFIEMIEAQNGQLKLKNQTGEIEEFSLDFKTILFFVTGAPYPPPAGFAKPPTIAFQVTSPYPRSNTCGSTLYLPLIKPLVSSEEFAYSMAFGILNAAGFGRV